MKKPVQQDGEFLRDVRTADPERLHLWWLGQSGFLLRWQRHHLLLDPYLSDSLTKKYDQTNKPHLRITERVVAPERLDFIEAVTSSHNHTDHLDGETLIPLLAANPALCVIVPQANLRFAAERLQVEPARLTPIRTDSDPVRVGPFLIAALPSAHEQLDTDENGDHRYVGYMISVGDKTIYHSGDACPYPGLAERLLEWKIDVALLPINGRDPARGVAGNFTAQEAVDLGLAVGAKLVIPCHYDLFAFNTVSPDAFVQYAQAGGLNYRVLCNGERMSLPVE